MSAGVCRQVNYVAVNYAIRVRLSRSANQWQPARMKTDEDCEGLVKSKQIQTVSEEILDGEGLSL